MKRLSSVEPEPGVDLAFGFALTMFVVGAIGWIGFVAGDSLAQYVVHAYCACRLH